MPRHKPRYMHVLVVTAFGLTASAAADSDTSTPALVVDISNVQTDEGKVGCSLYSKKDGFPSDPKKAKKSIFVTPRNGKATCTFEGVAPGKYAVSVMHDENEDGELETSMVGRPKEWWGVSNNVPPERFGPPKYEAATFDFSGKPKTIQVKLRL
ncbi:MAG TPA: DUF2141 domain-containing protein [Polyangiales bacterium]|nr:DUF2141 domain-containing protein [Polyangiales bacterium]